MLLSRTQLGVALPCAGSEQSQICWMSNKFFGNHLLRHLHLGDGLDVPFEVARSLHLHREHNDSFLSSEDGNRRSQPLL